MNALKSIIYQTVDTITSGRGVKRRIGGFDIRFPARYARYYEADYEAATFDFLQRNCPVGGTFLDCGAHIGLFSVVGAQIVGKTGKVFSFEPTPKTRETLSEVVRLNDCQNIVEVRNEAIAKESGSAVFFDTGGDVSNANSLVQTVGHADRLTVPTVSIDDFTARCQMQINLVKIDVEGAELDALRGGLQTFQNQRPPLSLGLHPNAIAETGASLEEIWNFLSQLDYQINCKGQAMKKDRFTAQNDLFDVQCYPQEEV